MPFLPNSEFIRTLSSWGSGNYRPSAPSLHEVASHVKQLPFRPLLLLYRNSKRMAINGMVKRLCKEEDVGYVNLWDSFVGKEEMYLRDGLHLSGKGAAVFAERLSGAVAGGLGKVRYLN